MNKKVMVGTIILALVFWAGVGLAGSLTDLEKLGGLIYRDKSLSINHNQSCQTCHHQSAGFADPDNLKDPLLFPVSEGSIAGRFGGRNAPTSAYAGFSPVFEWNADIGGYVGGMFWDGRAEGWRLGDPLAEQAQGPFTNPKEMALENADAVVAAVVASTYANLFLKVFPQTDFGDTQGTFDNIARAIAAFERSVQVTSFKSRFDSFWKKCRQLGIDVSTIDTGTDLAALPQNILTIQQLKGLALFNDPAKGNCAACHVTSDHIDGGKVLPPLFTDFSYDNLGIPTNQRLYELAGGAPPDLGLGGRLGEPAEDGKFKVPTLRNVARTAPYGHNGYFPALKEVVNFYNTRDVANWELPEVPDNLNITEIGNLGLTRQEEWAIVAFMQSLTDGRQ